MLESISKMRTDDVFINLQNCIECNHHVWSYAHFTLSNCLVCTLSAYSLSTELVFRVVFYSSFHLACGFSTIQTRSLLSGSFLRKQRI